MIRMIVEGGGMEDWPQGDRQSVKDIYLGYTQRRRRLFNMKETRKEWGRGVGRLWNIHRGIDEALRRWTSKMKRHWREGQDGSISGDWTEQERWYVDGEIGGKGGMLMERRTEGWNADGGWGGEVYRRVEC